MKRSNAPTADEDARALVRQLREEVAHGVNLERTLQQLTGPERSALHTLTRAARDRRAELRAQEAAEAALGG